MDGSIEKGTTPVMVDPEAVTEPAASGTGALMQTPLLTVLLAQAQSGGPVYLLTGTVSAALLIRVGTDLLNLAEQQQS